MSIHPDWFPSYLLEYAHWRAVPIISADYRLLPEVTGLEILDDLSSLWDWIRRRDGGGGLQQFISSFYPSLDIDADCILAEGESAGGYLVVQAALSRFPGLRAVIAAYPMLDLRAPYYTQKFEKIIPMLPEKIISDHLNSMRKGDVFSSVLPPARLDLGKAVIQQGRFVEFLGDDDILFPVERVKVAAAATETATTPTSSSSMARLWIYHGKQDTGIPASGSIEFVKYARRVWAESDLRLDLPDGEHGLDKDEDLEDATGWLRNGMMWVEEPWLSIL